MALVQMGHCGVPHRHLALVRNQDSHGAPLGLIVLAGNVQHSGSDHVRHIHQQFGQPFGIVLLVDIGYVILLFPLGLGVAHVIDIEAQGLGQIVKAVQGKFLAHVFSFILRNCHKISSARMPIKKSK